jgi:hypothetical protein
VQVPTGFSLPTFNPRRESAFPAKPERRFHFPAVPRLRSRATPGKFRGMKFPRLLLPLAALVLTAGCAPSGRYTKLRVTNQRGQVEAEWVARGSIHRTDQGYRITAVERLSGPPYRMLSKYPDGWRTTVTGPHILHWSCGEPYWLYDLENE